MHYNQLLSKLKQLQPIDTSVVSTLYTLSEKSLLTAIIFTLLITSFLHSELTYSILIWCGTLVSFLLFRLYNAYLYRKKPQMHTLEIWHKKFMIFAFITGILVSTLGFAYIHYLNEYHQLFVLASLLGLSAGATTSLASDFRIAIVYISLIMLPLIASLFIINTSVSNILAILMILFFLSQIAMIFNNYIEQKKVTELKKQKNLLQNLFSEAPLGMFSYDTNLNVLDANKHLHKMLKYPNNTIPGMNLESLNSLEVLNIFKNTLVQGSQSYLGPYRSLNDSDFWVKTTSFPFKSVENTIIGGVGIIEDKTEEYIAKKELESLHLKLQDQIEHNQLLLDENKIFIADMVHQIRTPLSVIMTNSSLIEMKTDKDVSSYITQINSAINMLSNSYEDLSYIISNDTIEYKPVEIDLSDFLNERIDFFEVIAQANKKVISTNVDNGLKISMNDTELERLIDNNISNAIKHSNDKSEIEIVLERKSNPGVILQFISKGNDIHNVTKLFEKNYTENQGAKRSLGLGLNMVKMICEKNNIDYCAHSKNNTNTFTYIFKN
ncbi:histidine kinase dimerization/phospho-acceptor domain-containing protein [Sulfurovum sp.]|uniref:histidine kinase dimerization/phospho-acceptor domain-containing protein n=1 Tax=Sulfurovum sp. TaxID=1969726 RepID=UPI003C75F520